MKTNSSWGRSRKFQHGSAMLISMFVASIIIVFLPLYLVWVQTQYQSVAISQDWNNAMPICEAGIEEGFGFLNRHCYSNSVNLGTLHWTGTDGWSQVGQTTNGDNIYSAGIRYLGGSSMGSNYYQLYVIGNPAQSNGEKKPTLISIGYTPALVTKSGTTAAVGAHNSEVKYVGRRVKVKTELKSFFSWGMLSDGDMTGNGQFSLDAYDSVTWSNSFYGIYDARYRCYSNATMASVSGSINLGAQGTVYGSGQTSSSGTITNGVMGDASFISTNRSGIQSGFYESTLETTMEEVTLPNANYLPLIACNCTVTYTNPAVQAARITSDVYPSPPPPGGVITNTSGLVTSTNYPNPVPASGVVTNIITVTLGQYPATNTLPSTIIPPGVQTNASSAWFTNWAATITTAPTMPTNYAVPPGVIPGLKQTNQLLTAPPPAGCYDGAWSYVMQGGQPDRQKIPNGNNGVWYTNYMWNWKQYYAYQTIGSYSYSYRTYTYPTLVYIYTGTNIQAEVVTSSFKYVVNTGNWRPISGDLSMSGNDKMLVWGNATIYIPGSFSMSGQSQIIILKGASLKLYFGGNVSLAGQGIVNKNDTDPLQFQMYGLNTCTNISIGGNAGFTGTLYAPEADIRLNGGGNDRFDITGSIAGNTIRANGQFQVHYDINLARNGPANGFKAVSWVEERLNAPMTKY